jgi:hypothetical protein
VQSKHIRHLLSLLSFEKKEKICANFLDGCQPSPGNCLSIMIWAGLHARIMALLAEMRTLKSNKGNAQGEEKTLGVGVP